MRGREAGTLDEMRATGWVAERAREAGLHPAGDDSTFFQWWPMRRTRLSENSQIAIGGKPLQLWKDVVVLNNSVARRSICRSCSCATARRSATTERARQSRGDGASPPITTAAARPVHDSRQLPGRRSARWFAQRAAAIAQAGGAAAILVSDGSPIIDDGVRRDRGRDVARQYGIDSAGAPTGAFARPAQITQAGAETRRRRRRTAADAVAAMRGDSDALAAPRHARGGAGVRARSCSATVFNETFYYPSGNVIGMVKGTDPKLANEYVLFSGHQDHDGTRYP